MHQFLKKGIPLVTWLPGEGCYFPQGFDNSDQTQRRLATSADPSAIANTKAIRPPLPGDSPLARKVTLDSVTVNPYSGVYPTRGVEVYVPLATVVGDGWVTVWAWDTDEWTHTT